MNIRFAREGKEIGEYPEEAIVALIQSNVIQVSDKYWHQGMAEWGQVGAKWPVEAPPLIRAAASVSTGPVCPTCQRGLLVLKKVHRMSTPVVVIGWLLLVPSFLGILIGIIMLVATGGAATATSSALDTEIRTTLKRENIPDAICDHVIAGNALTDAEKTNLTDSQKSAISSAQLSLSAGKVGAGAGAAIAGGLSIGLIVTAFIGGLLGWLLVMKKKVLQCSACSTVIAAS
jgi:hypothetical protein